MGLRLPLRGNNTAAQVNPHTANRGNRMNGTHRLNLLSGTVACLALWLFGVAALPMSAQVVAKPPVTTPSAGGNSFDGPGDVRYQADRDSQDRRIDMFI